MMTLEDFKQIKYLDVLLQVRHKETGECILIYTDVQDDSFNIYSDKTGEILEDQDKYEIIEEIDYDQTNKVFCESCDENLATIVKNDNVWCSECIKILDIHEIDNNIYKFVNKDELRTLLFAKKININHLHRASEYKEYTKGIAIFDFDFDYDQYSVKLINAEKIGEF